MIPAGPRPKHSRTLSLLRGHDKAAGRIPCDAGRRCCSSLLSRDSREFRLWVVELWSIARHRKGPLRQGACSAPPPPRKRKSRRKLRRSMPGKGRSYAVKETPSFFHCRPKRKVKKTRVERLRVREARLAGTMSDVRICSPALTGRPTRTKQADTGSNINLQGKGGKILSGYYRKPAFVQAACARAAAMPRTAAWQI